MGITVSFTFLIISITELCFISPFLTNTNSLIFSDVKSGPDDYRHVDPEFTKEPVTQSVKEGGSGMVS